MKRLSNGQITHLKVLAQRISATVHVGKAGVSEAFLKGFEEALVGQELVKVRFSEFKDEKKTLAAQMAEKTGGELIWIVGHIAVFYRENSDSAKRKITFPSALTRPPHGDPAYR